ncbi:hypothetical protein NC796_22575 [Aliifodinibius sp. S!AR15-10]|uniref:hypothetical protein n=1 Tax=Aliifodinibius sp. S!AR15-10 TaxID=2950437 RepID=UPI00285F5943|nr:hypothetical protein [Aliifodinibius sp. S!AR15-10]MDR8393957.1 hypothetical protein [Aliifodinibius sp. S!AR15-10]
MEKEWLNTSLDERINWYNNELDSMFNFLVGKEPFEEDAVQANIIRELNEIKKKMQFDLKEKDESSGQNLLKAEYYQAIEAAYDQLPKPNEKRQEWFDKLGRANDIIAGAK